MEINRPIARRLCRLLFVLSVASVIAASFPPSLEAQNFIWTRQFGTSADDQVNAVAVSASGVYAGGNTSGVFAGQSAAGKSDAFVARFDNAGNRLWTRQFGSSESDWVFGLAADSTGVYAVGTTEGALAGQTALGISDIIIRKYDVNGNELWTRQFGSAGEDQGLAAAIDATGVYAAGAQFGDGFVRKYDFNGNELWTRLVATPSTEEVQGVAADSSGIYATGRGDFLQPGFGGFDTFVRKFDSDGNVIWTRQFGTDGNDYGHAIAVNSTGVYVAGDTTGAFSGQAHIGGLWDEFAAKYDLNGNLQWVRQFGTHFEDSAFGIAVAPTGIYVVGYNDGEALPGTTAQGSFDAFVKVYDTSGNQISVRQFGTAGQDFAYGVAADATGVYIGGQAGFLVAFPGQTNSGGTDGFLLRIPPPPDVSVGGVVNNASFAAHPAPLAPGSIAAVFGSNLNDGSVVLGSALGPDGKVVTSLGGASATVNGIAAPMFYSTMGQIGIQIPYQIAGQSTATIVVTAAGQSSLPRVFNVDSFAPGIFTTAQSGNGRAAALHQDGISPITGVTPARRNEIVIFFLTGLGGLNPSLETGALSVGNLATSPVTVSFDGTVVAAEFAGGAPGFAGLNQVNVRIPANATTGPDVPIRIIIGGRQTNEVTLPIAP